MQIKGGNPDSAKRWRTENAEIKDRRKYSMKTTRNGSPGAREYIVKRRRNVSAVTKEKTVQEQEMVKRLSERQLSQEQGKDQSTSR